MFRIGCQRTCVRTYVRWLGMYVGVRTLCAAGANFNHWGALVRGLGRLGAIARGPGHLESHYVGTYVLKKERAHCARAYHVRKYVGEPPPAFPDTHVEVSSARTRASAVRGRFWPSRGPQAISQVRTRARTVVAPARSSGTHARGT